MKSFITTALLLTLIQNAHAGRESGGGSLCLLKLQAVRQETLSYLPRIQSLKKFGILQDDLISVLKKISFDVEKNLEKNGKPVDAKNIPDEKVPKIIVDHDRCENILKNLDESLSFFIHEVLGLMKIENREDYSISKNILIELQNIMKENKIPKWKYACSIQRYHFSGYAGFEYLTMIDTYGSEHVSTGYLYSRSGRDLDDYFIQFEVSRGPFNLADPQLYYTIFRNIKHKGMLQEITIRTPIVFDTTHNWDDKGKVTKRIFDLPKGDFVEMTCYRSL